MDGACDTIGTHPRSLYRFANALHNLQGYECFGGTTMSKADVHEYLIHEPE
jgi:hypothetical protein